MLEVTKCAPQMAIRSVAKTSTSKACWATGIWRAIAAMGFHELRRHLEYKAAWRGGRVALADRWFPSSKLCACCGFRLETLVVDVRRWTCPGCGASHDRDVNAAINPRNMTVSSTASACGGEDAGPTRERRAKPVPAKQESNSKVIYG